MSTLFFNDMTLKLAKFSKNKQNYFLITVNRVKNFFFVQI